MVLGRQRGTRLRRETSMFQVRKKEQIRVKGISEIPRPCVCACICMCMRVHVRVRVCTPDRDGEIERDQRKRRPRK